MARLLYLPFCMVAACTFPSDAAVDLATCIRRGADAMRVVDTSSQVNCPVRSGRTVTAILTASTGDSGEIDVAALRRLGVPEEAIHYRGSDSPSVGRRVGLGPVNVYDAYFEGNRKYSNSSALGSQVKIAALMAKTGDRFRVTLRRRPDGTVEVIDLHGRTAPAANAAADDAVFANAFDKQISNIQVEGRGTVVRTLADDNEGGRHQRFIVRLSSGQTILIAHNIDLAARIPSLKAGDSITFSGEYEWSSKGGVVHWTHADPDGRHQAGWLRHNGRAYQ